MADMSERHEVRVRTGDSTIVFTADSEDGRLCIRQEPDGGKADEGCSIALSDPAELAAFFGGLRRMLSSLKQDEAPRVGEPPADRDGKSGRAMKRSRQREAG